MIRISVTAVDVIHGDMMTSCQRVIHHPIPGCLLAGFNKAPAPHPLKIEAAAYVAGRDWEKKFEVYYYRFTQ